MCQVQNALGMLRTCEKWSFFRKRILYFIKRGTDLWGEGRLQSFAKAFENMNFALLITIFKLFHYFVYTLK